MDTTPKSADKRRKRLAKGRSRSQTELQLRRYLPRRRHSDSSRLSLGANFASNGPSAPMPLASDNGICTPTTGNSPRSREGPRFLTSISSICSETKTSGSEVSSGSVDSPCSRMNPFEKHVLDNLTRPIWSPSVFDGVTSGGETPETTSWSIDHIARLFPHPIEESPSSHQNPYPVDEVTEAKAQEQINQFFGGSPVCPSPETNRSGVHISFRGGSEEDDLAASLARLSPNLKGAMKWDMSENPAPELLLQMGVAESQKRLSDGDESTSPHVRRRLELSFGDSMFSSPSTPGSGTECRRAAVVKDPFHSHHFLSSPVTSASPCSTGSVSISRFDQMDFSPNSNFNMTSPPITPVRLEDDVVMSESPFSM